MRLLTDADHFTGEKYLCVTVATFSKSIVQVNNGPSNRKQIVSVAAGLIPSDLNTMMQTGG